MNRGAICALQIFVQTGYRLKIATDYSPELIFAVHHEFVELNGLERYERPLPQNISKEDVRALRLPLPPLQQKFAALVERGTFARGATGGV